jgi:protein-disulfide isomerase
VSELLAERVRDVRALYVSFPLAYHRFALPAARAAECASESGGFRRWIDVVYSKQDSLGLKSWASYAVEAGIVDTARIQACATSRAEFVRIAAGQDFGSRIDLTGTPTVIANGWRFRDTPTKETLGRAIDDLLSGRSPR